MPDPMALALLALALGDSLKAPDGVPFAAYPVDGGPAVYTVAVVMADSVAYAAHGLEAVIQTPGEGQTLVLLWLPASTGVEVLPPGTTPPFPHRDRGRDGWCGRLFSIEWR